jgi:hypothetical protein
VCLPLPVCRLHPAPAAESPGCSNEVLFSSLPQLFLVLTCVSMHTTQNQLLLCVKSISALLLLLAVL